MNAAEPSEVIDPLEPMPHEFELKTNRVTAGWEAIILWHGKPMWALSAFSSISEKTAIQELRQHLNGLVRLAAVAEREIPLSMTTS